MINSLIPETIIIGLTHWFQDSYYLINSLIPGTFVWLTLLHLGIISLNSNTFYIDNNCTDNLLKGCGIKKGLIIWTTSDLQMAWQQANIRSDVGHWVGPRKWCVTKIRMRCWIQIHHLINFIMQHCSKWLVTYKLRKSHFIKSILINYI